jgi:hypothetical protein
MYCTCIIISRWILLRMRNVSNRSCRENENTLYMFSNFLSESRTIYQMRQKYGRARKATGDNTAHALCMLATATATHSECVILIVFFKATTVTRTRLNVTLYVHIGCLVVYTGWNKCFRIHLQMRLPQQCVLYSEWYVTMTYNGSRLSSPLYCTP